MNWNNRNTPESQKDVALAFFSFGEEFSYLVEWCRGPHLFLQFFLYSIIFLPHRRELPLFVLKTLLHVVSLLPVLHEPLHFGYRENVVLEVVDDLQQFVLRTRWLSGFGAAVGQRSAVGKALGHFLTAIVLPCYQGMAILASILRWRVYAGWRWICVARRRCCFCTLRYRHDYLTENFCMHAARRLNNETLISYECV